MNKSVLLLSSTLFLSTILVGCGGTAPVREDSVAVQGMGSDAALINARRGRADAQISAAQEQQYERQRRVADAEMEYQDRQDERAFKQANRRVGLFGSILGAVR